MDISKEELYDAMGELIYAVALADGFIQKEETDRLKELLLGHPWAAAIQWSFDYEKRKSKALEAAYQKALVTCQAYGPNEEYAFLMEVLEKVAEASDGVDEQESGVIDRFRNDLTTYFMNQ